MADAKREQEPLDGVIDHETLVQWYESFATNTQEPRKNALEDQQFYHSKQWTTDELAIFRKRNQPPVTFNRIAPKINYIRGTEVRTRIDPKAEPITPAHQDEAPAVTDALRYVADQSKFDRVRSLVTEEILVPGCAGAVLGVDPTNQKITLTKVRWDRFWYDPHSREPDFSDAKYLGTVVWWDLEDAKNDPQYAGKSDLLEDAAVGSGRSELFDPHEDKPRAWYDSDRKRVRICEVYYRHQNQWWVCHFTKGVHLIGPKPVPWVDEDGNNWCPLKATSGFVDEEGYRYGVVRNMISPQREVNARRAVELHNVIAKKFMYEQGAVSDPDGFQTELQKADGKLQVNPGALAEGRLQILDNAQTTQWSHMLYQDAKGEIDATGPSAPVVAGDQSVLSGRAIMAKQNIGSMELETIFDNLRAWQEDVFKGMWYLIRQTWTEGMWLRVRDSAKKEGYRFVAVNQEMLRAERLLQLVKDHEVPLDSAIRQIGLPAFQAMQLLQQASQMAQQQVQQFVQIAQQAGQQLPPQYMQQQMEQMTIRLLMQSPILQTPFRVNDISKIGIDIAIDASPDTSVVAQEEYAELLQAAKDGIFGLPPHILKPLLRSSNLRSKDEIIEAIDKPPDPAQVQMQQQHMQMQMQMMASQIQNLQAMAQKTQAQAIEAQAKAQIAIPAEAEKDKAQSLKYATEAGGNTVPQPPMMGGI